jgi:hypothetical protein
MNIKTKLILVATAVSLLSTPALAFRDMGDAGGDSAFAIPENHSHGAMHQRWGGYSNGYSGDAYRATVRPHQPSHRQAVHQSRHDTSR